jgi:arylsulfatase A-like enzyme/Flp pilus assembly protein TadD
MTQKGLAVVTTSLVLAMSSACSSAPPPRPALAARSLAGANVLLVTVDTLRRDRVGAYGSKAGLTPTLDRLAASGVRFTHAYTHAPMTLPAHASIFTGRTPVGHAVRANGTYRLPEDVPTLATVLRAAGYRTGAFVGAFVLDARFGLSRGFAEYDDRHAPSARTTFAFAERRAAEVVQAAGDWILSDSGTAPWLAWVHMFDPHAPYEAPQEFRAGHAPYDAEVAYTDAMLARLLDRLGAVRALDRTVIIVTADHGESLGDHGETTHGLFAYDATLAVPLIVSGPGIGAGVIEDAAGHFDLLPTICDLLGIAAPSALDGRSLTAVPPADRVVYFEALDAALTRGWAPLTGVASAGWKFIDLPEPELYDLVDDPHEVRNLAGRDAARAKALSDAKTAIVAAARAGAAPSATATLDDEATRRLRSLGYVAGTQGRSPSSEPGTIPITDGQGYSAADDPKRLVALNERFNTALSAFNMGQSSEAVEGFRAVLAERPDFQAARTSAATVLIATGRAKDAVTLLRQAPADQANSPDLLAKLGVALREAGDLQSAVAMLERARAGGTQNPELANDLGVVYARLGRTREARQLFEELLGRDPDDAATWNNLGVLELSSGRAREAAVAFRHAVDADDTRGDAWQGLGAALVGHDRPGAIDAWRRAERLLPRDYDLLFNLGMVLADSPSPRESLPYLERFVREAPRDQYASDIARVEAVIRRVSR